MRLKRLFAELIVVAASASIVLGAGCASATVEAAKLRVTAAIDTIKALHHPGRDSLAAVWDGDKYVQCRLMSDKSLRCEAAGALMQTSMAHVLTPERVGYLTAMGWKFDPSFGNYVQAFKPDAASDDVAERLLAALNLGYAADIEKLETETTSVPSEPCPPRNGPSQNLAGLINVDPAMAESAIHTCAYEPDGDPTVHLLPQGSTAADLITLYGPEVTAEIRRLRVNIHRDKAFVIFDSGLGYVQCRPETEPDVFECEAQSAESWPALAAVLTPERVTRLHAAGFADPGRAPNFSKTYPIDSIGDAALASEVLTLLHDVYGYYGATKLEVLTEESKTSEAGE